jgi:hypothetical protein
MKFYGTHQLLVHINLTDGKHYKEKQKSSVTRGSLAVEA